MDDDGPIAPQDIEPAFRRMIDAYPDAGVAAVRPNGLFCRIPDAVTLNGQHTLNGRAGIELVASESRGVVLEQFRQIGERGASEVAVRLASGRPGRYALFDTRDAYGVAMLVVREDESDAAAPSVPLPDMAPVRPRFGRERRTEMGDLIDVDDGLLGMLGYSREQFVARDAPRIVHPDDYQVLIGQWFDLLTAPPGSSRRVRARYIRSDGSWLWVETTLSRQQDGDGEAVVVLEIVDISDEMAAMDEVWRSRELLHRLTEALPIGVLQIDAEGRVVYANDRLHQIVGVPRAGTLRAQLDSLVDDDVSALAEAVDSVLASGAGADTELRFRAPGCHTLRYAQLSIRALRDQVETITGAIICVTDVTDSTRMRQELELRASFDMLTGCFNRATVMAAVERALESASGTAVVFVDLDGFKPINDRLGHAAGDRLLKAVADSLQQAVRSRDVVGRLGGDEFIVLCPGVASRELALEIGERVARAVRFETPLASEVVSIRASIGVAWSAEPGLSAEALVAAADAAMYESKRHGQHRPVIAA